MNKKLPIAVSTGVLTLALVLTGCADNSTAPSSESTSPSQSSSTSAANEADEMFVTMMIPHHEQAIEMADMLLAKDGADARVVELAEQIKAAQGPEIDKMLGWLEDWGVEYDPDSMGGMDHGSGRNTAICLTGVVEVTDPNAGSIVVAVVDPEHRASQPVLRVR